MPQPALITISQAEYTALLEIKEDSQIASELIALAIKAGRRASYDLMHACAEIPASERQAFYHKRAEYWVSIFKLDSGLKDYRHTLHREIDSLEGKVKRLQGLCTKHNIDMGNDCPDIF